jgi:hypothetical protein
MESAMESAMGLAQALDWQPTHRRPFESTYPFETRQHERPTPRTSASATASGCWSVWALDSDLAQASGWQAHAHRHAQPFGRQIEQ